MARAARSCATASPACRRWAAPVGLSAAPMLRAKLERMLRYRHATLAADLAAHAGVTPQAVRRRRRHRHDRLRAGAVPHHRRPPGDPAGAAASRPGRLPLGSGPGHDRRVGACRGRRRHQPRGRQRRRRALDVGAEAGPDRQPGPLGGLLAQAIARATPRPPVLVSVSATGFYGDRGEEPLGDEAAPGAGFFPSLAQAWEGAADQAASAGVRVAHPRFGIVLSPAGGALHKLLPPFLAGVGGPVGERAPMVRAGPRSTTRSRCCTSRPTTRGCAAPSMRWPLPRRGTPTSRARWAACSSARRSCRCPQPRSSCSSARWRRPHCLPAPACCPELLQEYRFRHRHAQLEAALRHVLGR